MIKKCQRCGKSFECRADDIQQCACYEITLSEKAKRYSEENYSDCLCVECLENIRVAKL